VRSIEFDAGAFDDLAWRAEQDRAQRFASSVSYETRNAIHLLASVKPEPLRNELAGCWSRRIDQEHRLVYQVLPDKIRILACRHHY
jgi:toxin YoeB